jgi:GTP-binding protein YchF
MRLGIVGLQGSGKSTVFQMLSQSTPDQWPQKGPAVSTVSAPDYRVDTLTDLTNPKKTVRAHLEYLLPRSNKAFVKDDNTDEGPWSAIRPCDAMLHIVRNFLLPKPDPSQAHRDWRRLDDDMIFHDLVVVEKRIERMALDKKRGRAIHDGEHTLLKQCMEKLDVGKPIRDYPELSESPLLKGYALLSAKPVLTVINNDDENEALPEWTKAMTRFPAVVIRGALEKELSELPSEEIQDFLTAYNLEGSSIERLVRYSCQVLGLITFFTVANREVRSWLIPKGTKALDAAGVIHTDMKKGFIRAEVLAYDDFATSKTYQQAKKEAKVHLEGKDYVVQDGDVLFFRFNV